MRATPNARVALCKENMSLVSANTERLYSYLLLLSPMLHLGRGGQLW